MTETNNSENTSSTVSIPRSNHHHQHHQAGVQKGNASIPGVTDFSRNMELDIEESIVQMKCVPRMWIILMMFCDDHDDGNTYYKNEECDDEYGSIGRPAFYVEWDPDFASGPLEDGEVESCTNSRFESSRA